MAYRKCLRSPVQQVLRPNLSIQNSAVHLRPTNGQWATWHSLTETGGECRSSDSSAYRLPFWLWQCWFHVFRSPRQRILETWISMQVRTDVVPFCNSCTPV